MDNTDKYRKVRFFCQHPVDFAGSGVNEPVIPPGQRMAFDTRPELPWTPESLTIVAYSQVPEPADDAAEDQPLEPVAQATDQAATGKGFVANLVALFRHKKQVDTIAAPYAPRHPPKPRKPRWERIINPCHVRLYAIELAGHKVEFDVNDVGPKIDLKGKRLRQINVAETLTCILENTSDRPVRVSVGYEGRSDASLYTLGTRVGRVAQQQRAYAVPSCGGAVDLIWRAPWPFRATRVWCHSADSCGDLYLCDIRVGNRSQSAGSSAVPVEMFEEGIDVTLDTLATSMDLAFTVENTSDEFRHIEFELEGFAADNGPFVEQTPGA